MALNSRRTIKRRLNGFDCNQISVTDSFLGPKRYFIGVEKLIKTKKIWITSCYITRSLDVSLSSSCDAFVYIQTLVIIISDDIYHGSFVTFFKSFPSLRLDFPLYIISRGKQKFSPLTICPNYYVFLVFLVFRFSVDFFVAQIFFSMRQLLPIDLCQFSVQVLHPYNKTDPRSESHSRRLNTCIRTIANHLLIFVFAWFNQTHLYMIISIGPISCVPDWEIRKSNTEFVKQMRFL